MVAEVIQPDEVSVLATQADWAWPTALRDIFQPRGVNLLVAQNPDEFVNVLRHRRIAATIVDTDPVAQPRRGLEVPSGTACAARATRGGLWTIKIIRLEFPKIPCILLASCVSEVMLTEALELEAFSVISKPVDMQILRDQLNRLFVRTYSSHIFSM